MPKRKRSNSVASAEGSELSNVAVARSPRRRYSQSRSRGTLARDSSPPFLDLALPLPSTPRHPPAGSDPPSASEQRDSDSDSDGDSDGDSTATGNGHGDCPGRMSAKAWDDSNKLLAYHVNAYSPTPLPAPLASHVADTLLRQWDGPRSPNPSRIVSMHPGLVMHNEPDAIRKLEPWLLYGPDADPMVTSQQNLHLGRKFLPHAPSDIVKDVYGLLSEPVPDTATGYLTRIQACASKGPDAETVFSVEEETALRLLMLTDRQLFPFLTAQWKAAVGESHQIAIFQGARDGAAIVNHLHDFYETAYGSPPSVLDAHHVSVTTDCTAVFVWMHWRGDNGTRFPPHYMRLLKSGVAADESQMSDVRLIIKNLLVYATGQRLASLKKALPLFLHNARRTSRAKKTSKTAAGSGTPPTPLAQPPTPSSLSSSQHDAKRQKTGASPPTQGSSSRTPRPGYEDDEEDE